MALGSFDPAATCRVLGLLAVPCSLVFAPERLRGRATLAAPRAIGLAHARRQEPPPAGRTRLAAWCGRHTRPDASRTTTVEEDEHQPRDIRTLHGGRLQRHPGRAPRCHGERDV